MDNKLINEIISLAENGGARGNDITAVYSRVYIALKKSLGITPYAEQIGAALALTGHNMVQMQTGEGKTFSAVFAACYEALSGGQVMILTFNDYLARRDYEWTKPVYDSMGISIGCITADTPRTDRRKIYSKQVVYLTAKEAGFDYLRDFVCFEPSEMVFPQKLNFAIVDEADSIMIDEARIPLVIAGDIAAEDDGSTDILEDYQPLMPSRTYTYLLNDSGEEFKRKPLLLSVFTDNEEIADGKPKEAPADKEEKPQKKGFFAKLFGKK